MSYTPLNHMTTDDLVTSVLNKEDATWEELELVNRIEQLEEKVKKHNNLVERMIAVEQSTKSAHHRLDELLVEVREEH